MPRKLKPLAQFQRRPARRSIMLRVAPGETLDLFDDVRVTWDEVAIYALRVYGRTPDERGYVEHLRRWNVPQRVRMAKLAGEWPAIQSRPIPPPRSCW